MAAHIGLAEQSLFNAGQVMTRFAVTTHDCAYQIETPWDSADSSATNYQLMHMHCYAENVMAVTMIVEACMQHVQRRDGETLSGVLRRGPSPSPNAQDRRSCSSSRPPTAAARTQSTC